jgi:sugar-specific transcriptional regulator TrmB
LAFQYEDIQTLTRLGLTVSQARIYLALVQSGPSTIRTISEVSKVAREHVYRTMVTLQKLGLFEKSIAKPVKFKATPMHDAVSILLQRRINETSELQEKTRELIQRFMKKNTKTTLQEEEPQFIMIPEKEALIKRREKLTANVQTSLDIIVSWKRFPQRVFRYGEAYKKALESRIKIRVIMDKPEDEKSLAQARKLVKDLKKYPSFGIRYILTPPPAIISVYDKKAALVSTSAIGGFAQHPALLLNNPCFLAIIQEYFELMWLTALEEIPKEIEVVDEALFFPSRKFMEAQRKQAKK